MDAIVDHCLASGMTLDDVGKLRRSYFRRRARTHCPNPETLIRSVFDLYNVFKDLKDPERNGASFFIPPAQALKLLKKQCKYIQLGLLSDPPDRPMYVKTRRSSLGFQWYRTLRGTSALEGYHQHLFRIIDARGRSASLRYKCALIAYFNYRWNVKSWVKAGTMAKIGHSFLWLRDLLCDIVASTPSLKGKVPAADGWHRLDTSRSPTVPHGLVHSQRRPMMFGDDCGNVGGDGSGGTAGGGGGGGSAGSGGGGGSVGSGSKAAALKKLKPHGQTRSSFWVEAMTGRRMQADLSTSAALMSALPTLAATPGASPAKVHAATALVTTASGIADAVESVSNSVGVQAQLSAAGFPALQSALRQATSAASASALRLTAVPGSNALAGPLFMPGVGSVNLGKHPGSHSSVAAAASAAASAASAVGDGESVGAGVGAGAGGSGSGAGALSPESSKKAKRAAQKRKERAKRKERKTPEELQRLKQTESVARQARRLAAAEQERLRKEESACKRQKTRVANNGGGDGSGGSGGKGGSSKGSKGSNSGKGGNSAT